MGIDLMDSETIGKMQYGHFFAVQNEETGSMDIFLRCKISIPAVWTFCQRAKSRNLQYGHFVALQNLHPGGMDILQHKKVSIPAVSSPCSRKKSSSAQFHYLLKEKNLCPAGFKAKPIGGRCVCAPFRKYQANEFQMENKKRRKLKQKKKGIGN
jgi:hypothetical protein